MPVPASGNTQCPWDRWPDPVDGHTLLGSTRLVPQPLVPPVETEVHTPLIKVPTPLADVGNTPLTEAGNQPPLVKVGNQLQQGLPLNCPPGQREVVMASRGIKGQYKGLKRKPVNTRTCHTRLGHHWPDWWQLARYMDMWLVGIHPLTTSPQQLLEHTTPESMPRW